MGVVQDELLEIRKLCEHVIPDSKLVSCVESLVRVEIKKSRVRCVIVCLQFPPDYPNCPILLELKSKHLSDRLLRKLTDSCEEKIKKFVGRPQILNVLKFINSFIEEYPLLSCYDEINEIKKELTLLDEIKLSQKTSQITLKVQQEKYVILCVIFIPKDYPDSCVDFELESNLPGVLNRFLKAQGKELCRQCVEPPLNAKKKDIFLVRPSLLPFALHIITSLRNFVQQVCPICTIVCIPADPQDVVADESADHHVERVYCGHLYHLKCLLNYLKKPPFKGGKKCPLCEKKIFHEKWKVGDKLAEDRWAHKQARERELLEVVDFLN